MRGRCHGRCFRLARLLADQSSRNPRAALPCQDSTRTLAGALVLSQGCSAAPVAEPLERDPHLIGDWLNTVVQQGPSALAFEYSGGSPPPPAKSTKSR